MEKYTVPTGEKQAISPQNRAIARKVDKFHSVCGELRFGTGA